MLHPQVDSEPRSQEQQVDPELAEMYRIGVWYDLRCEPYNPKWMPLTLGLATASYYAVLLNLVHWRDGVLI